MSYQLSTWPIFTNQCYVIRLKVIRFNDDICSWVHRKDVNNVYGNSMIQLLTVTQLYLTQLIMKIRSSIHINSLCCTYMKLVRSHAAYAASTHLYCIQSADAAGIHSSCRCSWHPFILQMQLPLSLLFCRQFCWQQVVFIC